MINATKDNFKEEVLESSIPVLVDFYANWCGPCRALAPILSEVATEADGKYKIVKVDCDSEVDLAKEYKINVLPTMLLFKNGAEAKRRIGASPKQDIISFLSE
jgi:thioredoxin 1